MTRTKKNVGKTVEALKHEDTFRKNIPTAEYESVMHEEDRDPVTVVYGRRNPDLDPQLVWRGKDVQDWSDLVVPAPPLFIQEKVQPKVLVDDLMRRCTADSGRDFEQIDLFADFNGIPDDRARTEFYAHDANWTNRMILGDSLQVMASLAEREGLRGQVQCVYLDPPYGIKFNSNFQWSTTSRDVKDGSADHITRDPEQVRAFRDTWKDGIHSYLTYLRDRLSVARDLLSPSGSIFLQISDQNVHLVRALLDEVFGSENFVSLITFKKTSGAGSPSGKTLTLPVVADYIVWYARDLASVKYRPLYRDKEIGGLGGGQYTWVEEADGHRRKATALERESGTTDGRFFRPGPLTSQTGGPTTMFDVEVEGVTYRPGKGGWKTNHEGMAKLKAANRLMGLGKTLCYVRYFDDFPLFPLTGLWEDTTTSGFGDPKVYVVQTNAKVVERCVLMTTDPGDLIVDPTCGSGTTAYVAERWARRWVTIDTSRVALALARARIMGARYPYYLLRDSARGRAKEAELSGHPSREGPASGDVRQGFVCVRIPHISLRDIVNNAEIDVIEDRWSAQTQQLLAELNASAGHDWQCWEVPSTSDPGWSAETRQVHSAWMTGMSGRQEAIASAIAAKTESEALNDRPYEDNKIVRVAGPFTVESLSPHRSVSFNESDELIDTGTDGSGAGGEDFATMVLANLSTAGVQQAQQDDKLDFVSVSPWPGKLICGEGRYRESGEDTAEKRAGIFVGPEFGTVARADLVEAAKEAGDADFDVLVCCAFNYEAHASEFNQLGRIPVLKARMNADLHMSEELKNTGKGNLFVIFGEPDIEVVDAEGDDTTEGQIRVRVNGVDVFDPSTGEIRSDSADGIACWFVDSDYNEESFFVRQAYFLGANDPYKALKTTLKAEIDQDAWKSLHSDTSRAFVKPESGRIAVKVINHLGDEVMKVLRVG
jgi:adenine-specific DNA-methyltransferase